MRAYEFINEARVKKEFDEKLVQDVKDAYDLGYRYDDIGNLVGLTRSQVNIILDRYYRDRVRRQEKLFGALTQEDRDNIFDLFSDGQTISQIADDMGISSTGIVSVLKDQIGQEEIDSELERRRTVPGTRITNKITPEMTQTMRDLYARGMGLKDISIELGGVVTAGPIYRKLKSMPDYPELRAKWEAHRMGVKTKQSTAKIYRPGTIGNLQSKGPGSKHTYRMFGSR